MFVLYLADTADNVTCLSYTCQILWEVFVFRTERLLLMLIYLYHNPSDVVKLAVLLFFFLFSGFKVSNLPPILVKSNFVV